MKKRLFQYLLGYGVSICVAIFVIVFYINEHKFSFSEYYPKIISDAAFVNASMFIGMWLLTLVSQQGTFDIFAYSFKKLRASLFRKNEKYQDVPKTFYDYRVIKQEEERQNINYLGVVGGSWLLVSILFMIIDCL